MLPAMLPASVFAALALGCVAPGPPELSSEPVSRDGLHRVESVTSGTLLLASDYETAGVSIVEAGGFHIQGCQVQFADPRLNEEAEGLADQLQQYLCDAVRREILSRSRTAENPDPRPGQAVIDVWLLNVHIEAPDIPAGTTAFISEPTAEMTFAMRAGIHGQQRDFLRYYDRSGTGTGTFVGPISRPDWAGIYRMVDGFIADALDGMYTALNALDRGALPPVGSGDDAGTQGPAHP